MAIAHSFKRLVEFIKDYRIQISSKEQYRGVKDTLVGWAIVGFWSVYAERISEPLTLELSFIFIYLSATIAIFLNVLFDSIIKGNSFTGLRSLLINANNEVHGSNAHLSVSGRIYAIYMRGFLATGGYIALNVAKIYFGVIDNSSIFGADALIFVLLSTWVLGEKRSIKEWLGILLACLGVFFILFVDVRSFNWKDGLVSGVAGIYSAFSFALIFMLTSVIVRHDTPLRITFHQCLVGVIVSVPVFLVHAILAYYSGDQFHFPSISGDVIKNSAILGILYATALFRFLRAFLFTEPVVIAVLGYSFVVFSIFFEMLFASFSITQNELIASSFIAIGCAFLLHEDYERNKRSEVKAEKPTYDVKDVLPSEESGRKIEIQNLKECYAALKAKFLSGQIDRYSYISQRHEFNKLLLSYSSEIKNTSIENIKILPDSVKFTFSPLNIEMETDGAARSVPFEVLNFGHYEPEDEQVAYNLIQDGGIIFDIGANIGWFALNFAKRFPTSRVYSFEPIPQTFEYLTKNIEANNVRNCQLFNFGLSDKEEEKTFYYFKGGSAIASIKNLIEHQKIQEIKCHVKTLDSIISDLNLPSLNFIKCDVEGSELAVIQGAIQSIKRFKPTILIEICEEWCQKCGYKSSDIISLLSSLGYGMFEERNLKLARVDLIKDVDVGRYNYFFLHLEKHKNLILNHSV